MKSLRSSWPILALIFVVLIFFRPFIFKGHLPIPADTIVGLYYPFRDFYSEQYPNGIPFKNFLITDPVRQLLPWRELSIDLLKRGEFPLWNPYNFGGTPMLANFQSAVFYPFNIFFFFLPLAIAWSFLILSQPILASLFMYFYLRNLKLSKLAVFLGALAFSFSGFFIAWLQWGTILHSILWLPLILLSIDKIIFSSQPMRISNIHIKNQKLIIWSIIFVFSLVSSFLAGHLQTFFYVVTVSVVYAIARWWQYGKERKILLLFAICYLLFAIITAVQWLPTTQFIFESARGLDQADWQKPGWFIPLPQLIQFIAPDFFGNPTTLNYFGVWNYAEFIGYIGVLPLVLSFFAILFRRDKKTLFFTSLALAALVFSIKNPISILPYRLDIPFLSTSQPTRMLGILDFSLVVLASLGFDSFLRETKIKKTLGVLSFLGVILIILWAIAVVNNLPVSRNNLILPTAIFLISAFSLLAIILNKNKMIKIFLLAILMGVVIFDLLRFAEKFTPFTKKEYLFPQTKTIEFLKAKEKEEGPFRFMTTDSRIFPPNFSIIYRLETVDGYDPLYLKRYAELIAASERGEPNINSPFGFNRIITPHNYESKIMDLLGVKYVLSLSDLRSPKLVKIFQEGQTRVYENNKALPRAFFVEEIKVVDGREEAIKAVFKEDFDPKRIAVIEPSLGGEANSPPRWNIGKAKIISYAENKVVISTENERDGFLILTDSFYPTWKARIDGASTEIYRTDYNFRGIVVSEGKHIVEFYISLF